MSVHKEAVDHRVGVGFSGAQDGAGKSGLVGGVGEVFGFEAEGGAVGVFHAAFADDGAIQEVATVELDGGLVGQDFRIFQVAGWRRVARISLYQRVSSGLTTKTELMGSSVSWTVVMS